MLQAIYSSLGQNDYVQIEKVCIYQPYSLALGHIPQHPLYVTMSSVTEHVWQFLET